MISHSLQVSRRHLLQTAGTGLGWLALSALLQADQSSPAVGANPLAPVNIPNSPPTSPWFRRWSGVLPGR